MTATLSVDAFQLSVRPVWVTFEAPSPLGVEGACVSGQAVVETMSVVFAERLPAASTASSASV